MSTKTLPAKEQRRMRTRAKISGTTQRPRLNVFISQKHVTAQIIDDIKGQTLASATTIKTDAKGTMTEKAIRVGEQIGKAAKAKKIKLVVFDRGSKIYHGRLHALAEAARGAGLEF